MNQSTNTAQSMFARPRMGFITGSTCGDACWHAREEICHCSCGGANHGVLRDGGDQPTRTCKIGGQFYELSAIATSWREADDTVTAIINERFPGLHHAGYGEFWPETYRPVIYRQISATQAKWPEVMAVPGAQRLIWSRPAGSRYLIWRDGQSVYTQVAS